MKSTHIVAICALIATIGVGVTYVRQSQPPTGITYQSTASEPLPASPQHIETPPLIQVQVTGQIAHPGAYRVPKGTRIYDLIQLSGGVLPQAKIDHLKLVAKLRDGQCVVIPAQKSSKLSTEDEPPVSPPIPINLNTATAKELAEIPGVGGANAKRLVKYRETHHGFTSLDELQNVPGLSKKARYTLPNTLSL